ncbi:hypothetical protein GCM10011579_027230 [Streptomyces albiflavescens]|uniref:Uncharacterized protein n=1 Tax=Streptomyces albiflavescens TaxID=1623582 RepID=A0A917Y1K9_9ACTN|nr:hypothetical protein GCM10011579_027230 [Streptomyces albiflavescens]
MANRRILARGHQGVGVAGAPWAQLQAVGEVENRLLGPGHPTCGNDRSYGGVGDHRGIVPHAFRRTISLIPGELTGLEGEVEGSGGHVYVRAEGDGELAEVFASLGRV